MESSYTASLWPKSSKIGIQTHHIVATLLHGPKIRDWIYFKDVSNFKIESPQKPVLSIPQIIENIWQNIDRKYHSNVLVKRLRRIEKDMSGEARVQFAKWIPDGDIGKFAGDLLRSLREDFTETMKLLRNPKFQKLLVEYPRAKRSFWVSYETQDEVSSQGRRALRGACNRFRLPGCVLKIRPGKSGSNCCHQDPA